MMRKRVLVIGGIHGNEHLGVELVKLLQQKPLKNVDAIIANRAAVQANKRYIESDLNRSFGAESKTLEARRASELKKFVRDYDVVFDFHNTETPGNNCTFVGEDSSKTLFGYSKQLGVLNCIYATYDCINKYCPNTLSIEVSKGGAKDDAQYWYERLQDIEEKQGTAKKLTIYRYLRRVSWEESRKLAVQNWKPFTPISNTDAKLLGAERGVVPIFIASTLTPYYATLLKKEKTI